ncbi:uncharacterized protein LOC100377640 [Saccoglossus kowalevskii]|uniref:Uncharacterized protein LOC100377640 n=1 Tax=Saccoglossus kowalevskii TaxID=10224 RepID=A0ABM0GWQ5_SACKO|nr:PREDICTED: uncharacterized protein LOC100377640 [Saccoglossus kowalevskii]
MSSSNSPESSPDTDQFRSFSPLSPDRPTPFGPTPSTSNANGSTGPARRALYPVDNNCDAFRSLMNAHGEDGPDSEIVIKKSDLVKIISNQEKILKQQGELRQHVVDSGGDSRRKKKKPPLKIKNMVHNIYSNLLEDGYSWDTTKQFGSECNMAITNKIKEAARSQLQGNCEDFVLDASRTYFFTKRKEVKRINAGKSIEFKKKQARRQRKQQKLSRRKSALQNSSSVNENDKHFLTLVLKTEYISSEDSDSAPETQDDDDDDDDEINIPAGRRAKSLCVRPLPWRSETLNRWFKFLDARHEKKIRKMGVKPMHVRKEGALSKRDPPLHPPMRAITNL